MASNPELQVKLQELDHELAVRRTPLHSIAPTMQQTDHVCIGRRHNTEGLREATHSATFAVLGPRRSGSDTATLANTLAWLRQWQPQP